MKRLSAWNRAVLASSTLCLIAAPYLHAQTAPAPTAPATSTDQDEQPIVLSPFVVDASEDAGSYRATSTLAGTRVRTDLKDVASAISVVTKQFLQDTGSKNNQDLLVYTTNTEVGGVLGNFSGVAGGGQFHEEGNLLRPQQNTRVRGLDAADNTRDYFLSDIPWDGFNVGRVDLQRGPNSILFGVGSPAGIINTSVNTAGFKNANSIENRLDQYGSVRFSVDLNRVIIPRVLAIRVAALNDETKYQQKPAFNNDRRYFGALRYDPQFFNEHAHTSIRLNYEDGRVNADRPRTLPPVDSITPWFKTGKDAQGNPYPNKVAVKSSDDVANLPDLAAIPWINPVSRPGRLFWNDVLARYGDINNSTPTSYMQAAGYGAFGIGPDGKTDLGIGGLISNLPQTISTYSAYAVKALPGGNNYADKTLDDRSIFDFFNKLIDGRNSYQWQKWHASNLAVSQTFFDDRLGFEFVYDMQRYQDGARRFLGNSDTYRLAIDINSTLADGSDNPDFGRPYVANSAEQNNSQAWIDRDSARFTVNGELRAEDFLGKNRLSNILGRHVFTGLISEDKKVQRVSSWATSAATADFPALFGAPLSLTAHFRSYDYIAYLGPTLKNASSAKGANLSAVNSIVKAPESAAVRYFDDKWAKGTAPTDPNYVNPAAPFTYTNGAGASVTSTQSENPANYGGWKSVPVRFLNADSGDRDALITNDTKTQTIIKSKSATWQGYFLDGAFVPVFGIRRDEVTNLSGSGKADVLGIVNQDYQYDQKSRNFTAGESKSWGAVLHLPKSWSEKLPGGTDIGVFYNRSSNFKADAPRGDLFGNQIANPLGKTKEYGFTISTLHDKVSLKVDWYETHVANATLTGASLGNNGYFLWAVPVWGTAFVVNADQGLKGNNANNSWAWNYAASDNGETALPGTPAFDNNPSTIKEKAAIDAWRQLPVEQSFFNAYGNEVALINVAALRAGNWTAADPIWNQKFDNQPTGSGLVGFSGGPQISVDTVSKGQEYELSAQPTKNWNISVNLSKTFASREAVAPTIVSYIDAMTKFLAGPAGDIRLWGSASNPLRGEWNNNVVVPYNVLLAQRGSNVPEIPPWKANAVTNYTFDHGPLKGVWVGGGYRWEDKRILGYGLKNINNPATVSIDITQPLYGPTDDHFDLWVGYSRRLTKKINWRVQLNLRNVGENTKLVPVSYEPDGTTAFSRIQSGTLYQLTNTIEF